MPTDISFPLRYTDSGSIKTTDDPTPGSTTGGTPATNWLQYSQGNHLLRTVTGERPLYPDFGIPLDLLYSTKIPEILAERIKLSLAQLQEVKAEVRIIKVVGGTIQLTVIFGDNTVVLELTDF